LPAVQFGVAPLQVMPLILPPQPSGSSPQVLPVSAQVFGEQPQDFLVFPVHSSPAAQLPQFNLVPQPSSDSPQVACNSTQLFGLHAQRSFTQDAPLQVSPHCTIPPQPSSLLPQSPGPQTAFTQPVGVVPDEVPCVSASFESV
jgi:hypothetical protein